MPLTSQSSLTLSPSLITDTQGCAGDYALTRIASYYLDCKRVKLYEFKVLGYCMRNKSCSHLSAYGVAGTPVDYRSLKHMVTVHVYAAWYLVGAFYTARR